MYPVIHLKETHGFFSGGTTLALERHLRMPKRKKTHEKNMHYMVAVEACACVRPQFKSCSTPSLACDFGKLISVCLSSSTGKWS